MLIEFTVGNYLSFKDKKTLSMEAASIKEYPDNTFEVGSYKLIKTAAIYGANSSGKSNLIKAMLKMKSIISNSAKQSSTDKIDVTPFLLNTDTEGKPSFFEILFLDIEENTRYRYGFEVTQDIVHAEWLFSCKGKKEEMLFVRELQNIDIGELFEEGKDLVSRTRENGLFLAVTDQFNGQSSKKILSLFQSLRIISGIDHKKSSIYTFETLLNPEFGNIVKRLLKYFHLGFNDIQIDEYTTKILFDKLQNFHEKAETVHNKYNLNGEIVGEYVFNLERDESSGTNKIFDLIGLISLSLMSRSVCVIDELDAKLHPLLTLEIIRLFHNSETNPNNAQLIFATHDTNLLSYGKFRRDQIYFTEKDRMEATDLYSLVEFKTEDGEKVRNDRNYEKDYIAGRYGAIPFIGDLSKVFANGGQDEQ